MRSLWHKAVEDGWLAVIMALATLVLLPAAAYASAWQGSTIIDALPEDAYRTDLAFDYAGDAMAVFEQRTAGVFRLYANRYVKGRGWEGPRIIDAAAGNACRGKVAFDKDGNAVVVFKQGSGNRYRIYASRYVKDKGWEKASTIDNGGGLVDGQDIVFDGTGRKAAAVFEEYDGRVFRVYANTYEAAKGWSGPVEIDGGEASSYFPYPMFDGQGNLHVIYYGEASIGLDAYVSRYDGRLRRWGAAKRISGPPPRQDSKDEGWTRVWGEVKNSIYSGSGRYTSSGWSPTKIDARYRDAYAPTLISGANGDMTAFFVGWDGAHLRGYAATTASGRGWGEKTLIDDGPPAAPDGPPAVPCDIEHMRAAVNSKGEIALVFTQWKKGNLRVHARIFRPGEGWGKADVIDAADETAYNPSVVFAGDGKIIVIWCQWGKKNVKSYVNIYAEGQGWATARRLDNDEGETCGVRLSAALDGSVIAIYEQEGRYADRHSGLDGNGIIVNRIFALDMI